MHTEHYCHTLDQLDRVAAIRAIHAALLHLTCPLDNRDDRDAIAALRQCLRDAGHMGFAK